VTSSSDKTGVLLVNLGTPDAPTPAAVRRYLSEFLSDTRVVEIPRVLWWLILHGIVLRLRPRKSAMAYKSIWTDRGSPLLVLTQGLADAVRSCLNNDGADVTQVTAAMRYGKPSIASQLEVMRQSGVERLIVLPLYPQYAAATTASTFDAIAAVFSRWRRIPALSFIADYHDHPAYISAVTRSIQAFRAEHGAQDLLLFSFHGLPQRCRDLGDPYANQCLYTAERIAAQLGLKPDEWRVVFQSRFGRAAWIKPYCVEVLKSLPSEGIRRVDVVCPGFAVDCLETLEEIAMTNRDIFLKAGGASYRYIPALNADETHAQVLAGLIKERLPGA
jgi:ferrochelatase